jgi:hypothetical protein
MERHVWGRCSAESVMQDMSRVKYSSQLLQQYCHKMHPVWCINRDLVQCSWCSDQTVGATDLFLSKASRPSGAPQPTNLGVPGTLPLDRKWLVCETHLAPSSGAKVDTGYGTPVGTGNFSLFQSIQTSSGAHQSNLLGTGGCLVGDKVSDAEADHSHPSLLRLRMSGAIPLLPVPSWHAQEQFYCFYVPA